MSSLLLRSSAVRRALSAASREHGPSFRRAISAAATASGGGLEAAVARGPTLPYRCRNLTVHSREKMNQPLNVENIDCALDKLFIVCGGIRVLAKERKPVSLFVWWAYGVGPIIVAGAVAKAAKHSGVTQPCDNNRI
ncbi:uncharacterized protein LOC102701233 [Oryza brachyantha]|uniref:uncharacterized protein LOC102701233 n=1 Tax=Oryza brachyantha TaxID=4533 RepID=UPI0003EABF7B|nr:uncharacterized protein LOC102701233 [Oryza brachyantha]XP_015688388.1 uncharacterized protein LOC102701233 [Oryza brachyantha]